MKKVIRVLIILLCCIPLLVNALDYENGVKKAKTYMTSDYKDTYQLYLIDGATKQLPFGFDATTNKHVIDSAFNSIGGSALPTLGAFISRKEFEISKEKSNSLISSYMYDGRSFWTLTGNGSGSHYVVGEEGFVSDTSTSPAVKVTEFVDPSTMVIGKGTKTDPWIFQPKYRITVKGVNGTVTPETQVVNKSSGSATFTMTPNTGSEYTYNDCGLTNRINGNNITFEGINRNISCKIVFGKGVYKLSFNSSETTDPKIIYVKTGEKAYYEEEAKTIFNQLTTLPTKTGYTLGGYYYHVSDAEKVLLLDERGNIKYNIINKVVHDDDMETNWIPKTFTVNLNANGGNVSTPSITVKYDGTYESLPDATRTGHDFLGWYTSIDGGNKVEKTQQVKILNNITLFAHWKAQTYTLTYNANGGSVNPATTTVTYGSNYPSSMPTPTKRGHRFDGWFTSASGGSAVTSSTVVTATSNHSIFAHWTAISYTCSGGYYLAKNAVSCSDCPGGSYCPGGTFTFSDSKDQGKNGCPSGYTSNAKTSAQSSCYMNVPDGKYLATAKAGSATNCAAGTYKAAHKVDYGKTSSCTKCKDGYISAAGKKSCTACPSGQTSNSNHTSCYTPSVTCQKKTRYRYTTYDPCGGDCSVLVCGYAYCGWDNSCTYCTNIWDGCYNFGGGYAAFEWKTKTETQTFSGGSCPSGWTKV